jgi:thymidylate synthase
MNNLDKQYTALLQDILDNGVTKQDRTGTGTLSVFGRQIRHKMSDGFPLLTTKKLHFKSIVGELLWFLKGSTDIRELWKDDIKIWDGDWYKQYLTTCSEPYTLEEVKQKVKDNNYSFHDSMFDMGPIYGKQWRSWYTRELMFRSDVVGEPQSLPEFFEVKVPIDQIANLINDLKTNPDSRRLMVNAWNVGELDQMVLPPCHYGFQVYTRELTMEEKSQYKRENKETYPVSKWRDDMGISKEEYFNQIGVPTRAISLMWNQRSVDTFLGLPFNIASYGLLLEIIAKEVNMIPDELIGNLGDTHLYLNHVEQAKEQIGREYTHKERKRMLEDAMTEDIYNEAVANLMPFGGGMSEYYDEYKIPTHTREPYPLPKLFFKYEKETYVNDYELDGFILKDYQSHPSIKAPLSN